MPCIGEKYEDIPLNEVSKVLKKKEFIDEEMDLLTRLERYNINLERFNKYFNIPKRKCAMDVAQIIKPPFYTDEYLKHPAESTIHRVPDTGEQVIYNKALKNLNEVFNSVDTVKKVFINLARLFNVGYGIKILHDNDMHHGDIKSLNAMAFQEDKIVFKIIDNSEIQKISEIRNSFNIYGALYFAGAPTTPWKIFFNEFNNPHIGLKQVKKQIFMDKSNLAELIKKNKKFNERSITYFIKIMKTLPLTDKLFNASELYYLKDNIDKLFTEKTYGYNGVKDGVFDINTLIANITKGPNNLEQIISIDLRKMGSDEEIKNSLFKRVDIYGFGLIIYELVAKFFNNYLRKHSGNPKPIDIDLKAILLKMPGIAFDCMSYEVYPRNINNILSKYELELTSIKSLNSEQAKNLHKDIPEYLFEVDFERNPAYNIDYIADVRKNRFPLDIRSPVLPTLSSREASIPREPTFAPRSQGVQDTTPLKRVLFEETTNGDVTGIDPPVYLQASSDLPVATGAGAEPVPVPRTDFVRLPPLRPVKPKSNKSLGGLIYSLFSKK